MTGWQRRRRAPGSRLKLTAQGNDNAKVARVGARRRSSHPPPKRQWASCVLRKLFLSEQAPPLCPL